MVKHVLLTMSDMLYEELQQKSKTTGYLTLQELINDCIRKQILQQDKNQEERSKKTEEGDKKKKKSKAGRPTKIDEVKFLQQNKIFTTKHGKKYMF